MSRAALSLIAVVVLTASTFAQIQPAPAPGMPTGMPPRDRSSTPGTAVLRGRVFAADTGQPLRKAQIRIVAPDLRENRMTTTDADGKYEFKEVVAGRYTISAQKGSYVALQYGQQRPFEAGKPLEVLDGQTIEKIDFQLPRGGVITGRIFDEFGEPVSDVQVAMMRYQMMGGRRRLVNAGRFASTNDIGEFRLFAVPPGQYYLSATLRNMNMMGGDSDDHSGYAPTYFPGTPAIGDAQRITIGVGQVINDVTMALMPTRTARVSGTALDSQGHPLTGMIMVVPKSDTPMMMIGGAGQIRPDGAFAVTGLAPGSYTLQAQPIGPDGEAASVDVVINGDDISGIRLIGSRPSILSGRVIADPAAAKSLRPSQFRIMPVPAQMGGMFFGPGNTPAVVNDDWTFEVKARPSGAMTLNVNGGPPGWAVHAIHYRGTDVTDSGIDFRPGEDVSGIEIELTNRVTEVSGLVSNARGEVVKDYSVVVFATDRERWGVMARYTRTGRPDQDGRFKLTSLPAGSYYAVAVDYIEPGDNNDPAVLERLKDKAISFSLGDGEKKTLDLRIAAGS